MKTFVMKMIVLMAIVLMATGCGAKTQDTSKIFEENANEVIKKMAEKAKSEEYIQFYTNYDIVADVIGKVADGDYSVPKNIYKITFTSEGIQELLAMEGGETKNLSESLKAELEDKMVAAIGTMLNSNAGAQAVVLASVLQTEQCFVCENVIEKCIYLYFYEQGAPVVISFVPGKDNTVMARGVFVVREDMEEFNPENINQAIEEIKQYIEVEIEKVK